MRVGVAIAVLLAASPALARSDGVRCAQEPGDALVACEASIARDGGKAAVTITFPSGFSRTLLFENGAFQRGNATMSGVGTDTDWRGEGATHWVRVDDQRFEVPTALLRGE